MILYATGDLLESKADVLVNPVNTQGVMGKGLALAFKQRFPGMFQKYETLCKEKHIKIGKLWWWNFSEFSRYVVCFPTKDNWRKPSKLTYIEYGLRQFVEEHSDYDIQTVAWPMLGCGLGGLDWKTQVEPLMTKYLEPLSIVSTFYVKEIK